MSGNHKCPLGDKCCQGEGEIFWIDDITKLFCSLSPVPYGNLGSGERLNAATRFVIYLAIIMVCVGYKYTKEFFLISLLFIILLHFARKNKKEDFGFLSPDMLRNQMNPPPSKFEQLSTNPQFQNVPGREQVLFKSHMQELPIYSANITNNYRGSSETVLKSKNLDFELGNRIKEGAGIQYFAPKQGVNRKTMINPVIPPRILDQDVWGQSRIVRDGINNQYMVDMTHSELDYGETFGIQDPRGLAAPAYHEPRVKGAVVPMNNIKDPLNIARYGSGEIYYDNLTRRDFDKNVMPVYENFYKKINNNIINTNTDTMMNYDYNYSIPKTENTPSEVVLPQRETQKPASAPTKERFGFVNMNNQKDSPSLGNYKSYDYSKNIEQDFGNMAQPQQFDKQYNMMERGITPKTTPISNIVKDQLIGESPTYVYNEQYFNQPSSRIFLQDIQPKLYSYAVDQTPVNANIGITYNPQRPPRFMDQIIDTQRAYPLMTRIDPQLIRDDGTPGQISMNPVRTDWSAKYSDYEAPAGSINFEDIYDPRFNSYGDGERAYSDINTGQVRYYYSDVDAYRMPNFIQRSNVDFVDFTNPQGEVWPYYNRTASLDDVRDKFENQTTADEIYHREDIQEQLMAKMNRTSWQQRYAPLRRSANGNSSYGPN
jgi:hypothetical protein